MPLPSLLRTAKKPGAERQHGTAVDDTAPVQAARTRARRRLIGAVVLLAIGVVGFPLVFETQPRPVALDTPIEIAARTDAASPAPATEPATAPAPAPAPRTASAPPPAEDIITEPAPRAAAGSTSAPRAPAPPPADKTATEPAPHPGVPAPPATPAADDGARARALLDGAPPASAAAAPRFVVQAGAYTDANALRDARQKVEKLGLKTYTQVVDVDGTRRTRVRSGPYPTRAEADAAAAKVRAAGLQAAIIVL